jgi:hypothetical protein
MLNYFKLLTVFFDDPNKVLKQIITKKFYRILLYKKGLTTEMPQQTLIEIVRLFMNLNIEK